MCAECKCNSLAGNSWQHLRMLAAGSADLRDIPRLKAQAEGADRIYRALMEKEGWTEEDLLRIAGYSLSTLTSPINN